MSEISRWIIFVDWFEHAILRRMGLVFLRTHKTETKFYLDWLVDLAMNQPISEFEKNSILAGKKTWIETTTSTGGMTLETKGSFETNPFPKHE